MVDCLIVGSGVIGLSLAYELAGHGLRVRVIDAGQPGREASWAGAGILPPASDASDDPLERLTALSNQLHRQWSAELREETHLDNGYRRCGAIYLARDAAEQSALEAMMTAWMRAGHSVERLRVDGPGVEGKNAAELARLEPALRSSQELLSAWLVPEESQIRNPRHLQALLMACTRRGVELSPGTAADDFDIRGQRLRGVISRGETLVAEQYCLTSGAWTAGLTAKLGLSLAIKPIRGQMLLLAQLGQSVSRIVNEGPRYLVPRADGRLLVGSTEEDAGFDRSTTAGAMSGLLQFALSLVPQLRAAQVERNWAGLRPATADGRPYLGRAPGLENLWVAAGHFRSGLQQSTGTARIVGQWIRGEPGQLDLSACALDRASGRHRPLQLGGSRHSAGTY